MEEPVELPVRLMFRIFFPRFRAAPNRMMGEAGDALGNLRRRQNEIGDTGGNRATRHAIELGSRRLLYEGHPALAFDRLESQSAVRRGSREHHTDGVAAVLKRQGSQELIDGQVP